MVNQCTTIRLILTAASIFGLLRSCVATTIGSDRMIDPSTPPEAALRDDYELVFSDEFHEAGRSFENGDDARWQSVTKPAAGSGQAAQFYNASEDWISTEDGALRLRAGPVKAQWMAWLDRARAAVPQSRPYTSSMISSWNQVCFTGGVIEVRARMPSSDARVQPKIALMGNLASVANDASFAGVWPWSYDQCKKEYASAQRFSACDHWLSGSTSSSASTHEGRGAPEISLVAATSSDVLADQSTEATSGDTKAKKTLAVEYVVAPGIEDEERPEPLQVSNASSGWYHLELSPADSSPTTVTSSIDTSNYGGLTCGTNGEFLNSGDLNCPAPYTVDRIAASLHWPNENATERSTSSRSDKSGATDNATIESSSNGADDYHVYRLEWEPGESLQWFVDGVLVLALTQANLHDKTGANIPHEPMYLYAAAPVAAAAPFSSSSSSVGTAESSGDAPVASAEEEVLEEVVILDYVRVYQAPARHSVGCSPENYPTEAYIRANPSLFKAWAPRLTPFATSKSTIQLFSVLLPGLIFALTMAFFVLGVRGLVRAVQCCWRWRADANETSPNTATERSSLVAYAQAPRVELTKSTLSSKEGTGLL